MIDMIREYLTWQNVSEGLWLLVAVGTFITRLTPTTKDDGFMARVDGWVQKFMNFVGMPNRLKK